MGVSLSGCLSVSDRAPAAREKDRRITSRLTQEAERVSYGLPRFLARAPLLRLAGSIRSNH